MKKKTMRNAALAALLALLLLAAATGCSAAGGVPGLPGTGTSQSLDIDYVGTDGTITEEAVTAENESMMDWLKEKLSSDKEKAGRATGREEMTPTVQASQDQETEGLRAAYEQAREETVETGEQGEAAPEDTAPKPAQPQAQETKPQTPKEQPQEQGQASQEAPQAQESQKPQTQKKNTVTFTIRCDTAVANGMHKESKWAGIVPASGCILPVTTLEFEEGETVFDLLCRIRDTYKLQMEYSGANGGEYIEGINNLYEFDGGRWSGWMYCVNDWYPNYGCGQYAVQDGDVIEWNYTCDLGLDLDGSWWEGAQDWKDTHE